MKLGAQIEKSYQCFQHRASITTFLFFLFKAFDFSEVFKPCFFLSALPRRDFFALASRSPVFHLSRFQAEYQAK